MRGGSKEQRYRRRTPELEGMTRGTSARNGGYGIQPEIEDTPRHVTERSVPDEDEVQQASNSNFGDNNAISSILI